jgi:hypothetical protein
MSEKTESFIVSVIQIILVMIFIRVIFKVLSANYRLILKNRWATGLISNIRNPDILNEERFWLRS